MSIENSLERIASALEAIAKSKTGLEAVTRNPAKETEATQASIQRPRPGKKVEVRPDIEEEFLSDETKLEEVEPDPDLKWPDINKKLFGMLGQVRDTNGTHKEVCAKLMKKYSGGKPFSESSVKPSAYSALLADIEAELEALNG